MWVKAGQAKEVNQAYYLFLWLLALAIRIAGIPKT